MKATTHRPECLQSTSPNQLREGNPACCNSPHQRQQLSVDCQREDASAIDSQYLDTGNNPSIQSSSTSVEQTFHKDSSEWKTYLVDYRYQGKTWCLEMSATSWEDARARVRCLINANVEGQVALKIPVPESWFKRVQKWLSIF